VTCLVAPISSFIPVRPWNLNWRKNGFCSHVAYTVLWVTEDGFTNSSIPKCSYSQKPALELPIGFHENATSDALHWPLTAEEQGSHRYFSNSAFVGVLAETCDKHFGVVFCKCLCAMTVGNPVARWPSVIQDVQCSSFS
jgi:hypothetical protein